MEQTLSYPQHIVRFFSIMNQLHRLAMQHHCEKPPGMTIPQIATITILTLSSEQDVFQRDLEHILKLRRSTISSLLNTLERKELIQRIPVPQDARLKKLVLTEEGRRIGALVYQVFSQTNDAMVEGFTQEEQDTLSSLLLRIEQNLNQVEVQHEK